MLSNANAGAVPIDGKALWRAFHEQAGVDRIVDGLVTRNIADPRIGDIFKNQDLVRLRRLLKEQFCYILGGGCDYTGRNMKDAHKDLGLQTADLAALIENLQAAMREEGVPFMAQNRFAGEAGADEAGFDRAVTATRVGRWAVSCYPKSGAAAPVPQPPRERYASDVDPRRL